MAKLSHEEILAFLEEATILELNELVKAIEEKFGVTAAAPVAAAAPAEEETVAKGPVEVALWIKSIGASKVQVIKAVQAITGLGLIDAKKLVDGAPVAIKEKISPEEANTYKEQLTAAGAEVEVK